MSALDRLEGEKFMQMSGGTYVSGEELINRIKSNERPIVRVTETILSALDKHTDKHSLRLGMLTQVIAYKPMGSMFLLRLDTKKFKHFNSRYADGSQIDGSVVNLYFRAGKSLEATSFYALPKSPSSFLQTWLKRIGQGQTRLEYTEWLEGALVKAREKMTDLTLTMQQIADEG